VPGQIKLIFIDKIMRNTRHIKTYIFVAITFIVGTIFGVNFTNFGNNTAENQPSDILATSSDLEHSSTTAHTIEHSHPFIIDQLEAESNNRKKLEKTISDLKVQITELTARQNNSNVANKPDPSSESQNSSRWFNEEAMLSTGLSSEEISELKNNYETIEMEKLYLRDRAIRENWIGSERYTTELSELNNRFDSFRNQTNDNVYETLLYATGQDNRVVVQDVMQKSPASQAGIKTGDFLLQYGETKIFSAFDLRRAITDGEAGEEVKIDINRNGTVLSVYLPRGPMGIRMESKSVQP